MSRKPQILRRNIVAKSRLFAIEQIKLRFSNGQERDFERLIPYAKSIVLVVPMLDQDTVLLIKEYAAGIEDYTLGLCKGFMEEGEDILCAAKRELMEEVGYGANQLDFITSMTHAPGYSNSITHLVLARDLYPAKIQGDEPEELEVIPWKLSQLSQLINRDDFSEARSIAALFLAQNFLSNKTPCVNTESFKF